MEARTENRLVFIMLFDPLFNFDLANLEMRFDISVWSNQICIFKGNPNHRLGNPIAVEICSSYAVTKTSKGLRCCARDGLEPRTVVTKNKNLSGIKLALRFLFRGANQNVRSPVASKIVA